MFTIDQGYIMKNMMMKYLADATIHQRSKASCQRQSLAEARTSSCAGRVCRKEGSQWWGRGFKYRRVPSGQIEVTLVACESN